jgi:hypothetical protein
MKRIALNPKNNLFPTASASFLQSGIFLPNAFEQRFLLYQGPYLLSPPGKAHLAEMPRTIHEPSRSASRVTAKTVCQCIFIYLLVIDESFGEIA